MSRTTFALIAFAVALAVHIFVILPLEGSREAIQEQLFIEHKSLIKHERFLTESAGAKQELESLKRKMQRLEKRIVREKDSSLAFASIQGAVQDMASSAGIRVNSIKPLSPDETGVYSRMPLFLDGTGDMLGLSSFLKLLDSSRELISIDKLGITRGRKGKLRIKIELSGLMKK